MIAVLSSSSPIVSVALFEQDGKLVASHRREAAGAASGASISMLDEALRVTGRKLEDIRLFVADTGPGSFTGVKVSVVLAKALAFSIDRKVDGISSFDLIERGAVVAIPTRKGEWIVRQNADPPLRTHVFPPGAWGYGEGVPSPRYPDAANAGPSLDLLRGIEPEHLLPTYFAEPSISTPKKAYRISPMGEPT